MWLRSTKRSRAKAKSFAKRTHWSYQTPFSNNTREDSTHGHHQMVNTKIKLTTFFAAEDEEAHDCGSDHELFIVKFRLKLKKVGKITRPFRYDLNQIPYDYTVEVRNRFKGLDLIECLKNYGPWFMTLYRGRDQDHLQ